MAEEMPPSQQLMPGLRFEAGDPWHLIADSIDVLRGALGDPLTNAFVRCFAAADRLMTILDMILLNRQHVGEDTVRGERNISALGTFAVGLVYEFREGVRQLEVAGVASRLGPRGQERWSRLNELARPQNEDTLCQIRNCLAFHLGDADVVDRGMAVLAAERTQIIINSGQGGAKVMGRHDFAAQVVMNGIRIRPPGVPPGTPNGRRPITKEDFEAALGEGVSGHFAVIRLLDDVFADALRQAGAQIDELDAYADDEDTAVS